MPLALVTSLKEEEDHKKRPMSYIILTKG